MVDWKCDGVAGIAAIGECMLERRDAAPPDAAPAFSGDTLNTLTYMARLLDRNRADLFYVTALGTDPASATMLAAWETEGINTRFVRRLPDRLPGSYTISVGEGGERRFSYDRDKSAARDLFSDGHAAGLSKSLEGLKLLYLSGITLAILAPDCRERLLSLLQTLRRAGVIIVYDQNYRAALWSSPEAARAWGERVYHETDVALPGFDDEKALFNDVTPERVCARLADLGVAEIVVKNGSSPCTVASGAAVGRVPVAVQDRVVDTTAAGDSFNAGYISARLCGNDVDGSVRSGQSLAARVIQYPGAIIPRAATPSLRRLTR